MVKKIILLALGALIAFSILGSCNHKSKDYECSETSFQLESDKSPEPSCKLELGENVLISSSYDEVTIKLGEILDRCDVFDARELLSPSYLDLDNMKIKFDTDAEIIKAQYIENYYPTIWSELEDNLIQFVYLYDLGRSYKENLKIEDGNTIHVIRSSQPYKEIEKGFANITKEMVLSSIDNIPANYKEKEAMGSYESQDWNVEVKKWKGMVSRYKPGDFKFSPKVFDISPYENYLIVTLKGKDGSISTKIFKDYAIVGN